MNAYRVKEVSWGIIALAVLCIALSGCSSTSQKTARLEPQYCYTNQEIEVENGKNVSSRTRVECTDDRTKKLFQARSGISKDCTEFYFQMNIKGQPVERRGYACTKFDGSIEIFNPASNM